MTKLRHFLDIDEIDAETLRAIIDGSALDKAARKGLPSGATDAGSPLEGRVLAMVFEKPSTRTRVSFDMAMRQLGGQALLLSASEMQLGRGETPADTARVLSRYVDAIMLRTSSHDILHEMAEYADVPVINALTDYSHPCQIMADVLTFEEHRGSIAGKRVAWCGDGNNVATSWIHGAQRFGYELLLATPPELSPDQAVIERAIADGAKVSVTSDVNEAVDGADCVVTDTWVSMGDKDIDLRHNLLAPYQVTTTLMARAADDAIFMHDLPAHRGEEMTADVIDGPQSVVWDEAENRLHAQKGVLKWCLAA